MVEKILGHVDASVAGVYDRHAYWEERREALDAWVDRLNALLRQAVMFRAMIDRTKPGGAARTPPIHGRTPREIGTAAGRVGVLIGCLAIACAATPAEAQIVNTLRGWADPEPGLSGEVQASFGLAEGNSEYLELSAGGAIQLLRGRHRVRLLGSETLRRAEGRKIAENFLVHARHNIRITDWLHSLIFLQSQHNPFRRLERRTLLGLGGRFDLVRRNAWNASFGASYMFESERITDDESDEAEVDHRGSFFLSVVGKVTESLEVDASGFYQPRLDDFSDAQISFDASARNDLVGGLEKGLDLTMAFSVTRESNPAPGVEQTDLALTSGLVFSF